MGLVINAKYKCNTIGFLTNKGGKPLIKLNKLKVAKTYPDLGVVVLKPTIDRISFGFSPTQALLSKYAPGTKLRSYTDHVKKSLAGDGFNAGATGLSYVKGKGISFLKPPYSLYNVNLWFHPLKDSDPILIQVGPKKPGYSFIRFDMNPNRMKPAEMKKFWELIDGILVLPGGTISHKDFLAASKISKLEIAVDILGARPGDMDIKAASSGKAVAKKAHVYKSATGRQETVYPLLFKTSTEYIYDKRIEQIEAKKQPIYGEFLHARFETRLQKQRFTKMAKLQNRCKRVAIRCLDHAKYDALDYPEKLFIRYGLSRTSDKALEIIPDKLKKQYDAVYNHVLPSIWDADKIWSFWPETLKKSGFFPED